MNLSIADIEEYLSIVRQAVREDRYEIERNENREENLKLSWQSILCRNYQHVSPFFKTPRRKKSAPAFQRVPILLPYSAL